MNTLVRLNNCVAPDRIDDLFAGLFRASAAPASRASAAPASRVAHPIRIDVSEDINAYRVSAVVPGVKKEDIHVSVDQNEVTIATELRQENPAEGERVLHSERFYGKATRVFTVGQDIDEAGIQAKYTDGVLSLVLPKKAPVSARRITIE